MRPPKHDQVPVQAERASHRHSQISSAPSGDDNASRPGRATSLQKLKALDVKNKMGGVSKEEEERIAKEKK
jgi:hypothetical protein